MTAPLKKLNLALLVAACLAILVAGWHLRIQNSDARIFHSDEAVQAYQLWELMETGRYEYDPVDKHGPVLYYLSYALNGILGWEGATLSHTEVRLLPIFASIGLLLFLLANYRGVPGAAVIAALLFAISPFPVIYGAYYVQEMLFALIGFLLLHTASAYWSAPQRRTAILGGLWVGLFFATKETAVIHIAAMGVALFAIKGKPLDLAAWRSRLDPKRLSLALAALAVVWVFFFTAAFTDFGGIADSLKTFAIYAERSQGGGHEKPASYYLSLFWPQVAEGVRWGEAPFLVLAGIGFFLLVRNRDPQCQGVRLGVLYGFLCLALYTIIPYKTPWLMLTTYVSFCLAAGYTLARLFSSWPQFWARGILLAVTAFVIHDQYQSTRLANRYAADARNPYLYQHTSPQFKKLVERIEDIEALDESTTLAIAVGGDDNAWPLPWYLRNNDTVGYWTNPADVPPLDIVVGPVGSLPQSLQQTHIAEYHGLRENVLLECWIEKSLWDAFLETR